jgi:sigma-B regulation protein RsbU (phosphoserine phosphatase)
MPPARQRLSRPSLERHTSLFEHATLLEFSKVVNSSADLRFILSHILLTIMGRIASPGGFAALTSGNATYHVEMAKGLPDMREGRTFDIPKLPRTLLTGASLNAVRASWAKDLSKAGVDMVLPLVLGDRPVGFLAFAERLVRTRLTGKELTYLESLASLSASAVQKSHTIADLEVVNRKLDRRVQELNTLFDIGRELGTVLERDRLVRLLVFSLLGQVGVNRYLICLNDGPDMRVVASKIDGQPPQGELLAKLARLKEPILVDAITVRQFDVRPVLKGLGLGVVVPIRFKGEVRGLLLLGEKLSHEPFSEGDLEFLSLLGNMAMIALENARLFQEAIEKQRLEDELVIAREIQKGLLPSVLPAIPGIEIAAVNISSKQVGGDYYDVIAATRGRHVIAIGDVSGKGTPASLLMANLQATIRALVPLDLSLAELSGRVNDLMCQNTGGNKFVTFFWGLLDSAESTLSYVNAGHNYPYLIHADGTMDRLDCGGMILGVMPTVLPYEQQTIRFRAGDCLLLFTDGVSEAMSREAEEYGEARLEAVLRRSSHLSAQEVIAAIHEDVLRHAQGAQQSDDITMMVVRSLPHPS